MKETAKTGRINIGTASIVLILLILCLAVFSLLSLSDALSLGTVPEGASVEASEDSRTVTLTIPLSQGQSLLAEYRLSDGQLISSRIFNSEDYAIDTRLPVWTGPEGAETTAE